MPKDLKGEAKLLCAAQSAEALLKAVTSLNDVGAFRFLKNTYGAVWQISGLPPLPWDLRITSSTMAEQLLAR